MDNTASIPSSMLSKEQLLTTKLHMPSLSSRLLPRSRLQACLVEGTKRKLTLVSAPAGSGKTMLLCSWLTDPARCPLPFAWLSLDEDDNDPERFWQYIWHALGRLHPRLDSDALAAFQEQQPFLCTSLLLHLINELSATDTPFILVLDDYHLIHTATIHQSLLFLLDHLPEPMHLIIISREDPPLQLARLRARDQLVEIRAADLRFSFSETAAFLEEVMGLHLEAEDIGLLEARTEGWITGLQLVALSLRGRNPTQVSQFLATFAGNHRYILDYLVEEVLLRQSEQIQTFLLQTSLLDRLSGPLCDAVTGGTNSQILLEQLESHNLFVIPLDEERRWYRYHHLFAEVLHVRLRDEPYQGKVPTSLPLLHRRASVWYEQHFLLADAIHHEIAAGDFNRVAQLCEQIMQASLAHGELVLLRHWLGQIPRAILFHYPRLYAYYARALIVYGQIAEARIHVEEAERSLAEHGEHLHPEELSSLRGQLALARCLFAFLQGDSIRLKTLCRQAQQLIPAGHLLYGGVPMLLGMAYWLEGEIAQANANLLEAYAINQTTGNSFFYTRTLLVLAQTRAMQGSLQEEINLYKEAGVILAINDFKGNNPKILHENLIKDDIRFVEHRTKLTIEEILISAASLFYEINALEEAEKCLQRSMMLNQDEGNALYVVGARIIMARILQARDEEEQASLSMQEAVQLAREHHIFCTAIIPSIGAAQAKLALAQGDLETAVCWSRELSRRKRSAPLPSYLDEVNEIVLARLSLAQGKYTEALAQLSPLHLAVVAAGHMRNALEILILQALGERALGATTRALSSLDAALQFAEPEGYIRLFVDERAPMAELLTLFRAERGDATGFVSTLLLAFSAVKAQNDYFSSPAQSPCKRIQPLRELLSTREVEVLQFAATGASNQQIADQLIVAESTIKRHLHNIFGKLEVSNRTQAIVRARDLGLL